MGAVGVVYRNRHTSREVTIVGATMKAGTLYGYVDRSSSEDVYKVVFGLEGRDGTTFEPKHWQQVS